MDRRAFEGVKIDNDFDLIKSRWFHKLVFFFFFNFGSFYSLYGGLR